MSDKPYQKECLYCKQKIRMSKESGKWLPYDLNNGQHDCRKKHEAKTQPAKNNEISLELVMKKLESIGVTVDLEKLGNV